MSILAASRTVDDLVLAGRELSADVASVITGADLVQTMSGASTLELTLHDASRRLLRSGLVSQAPLDLDLDGLTFRHVATDKAGDSLRLTFEDLVVALLRKYKRPRKAFRDVMTRAQFAQQLVREVKEKRLSFYSPSLKVRQPIGKAQRQVDQQRSDEEREPGFADSASFKINTKAATTEQKRILARAFRVAASVNAPRLAYLALTVALIAESEVKNLSYGHSSSVGVLQLLNIHGTVQQRMDVERSVNLFLTRGFTGEGSAIQLAKDHPQWSPSQVAEKVQGNRDGASTYQPFEDEARDILAAYFGDDGPPSADGATTAARYEFTRGKPGEREDSWKALQRLAQEVGWRCFVVRGVIYFVSDADLMRSRPIMTLRENTEGVGDIDFRFDSGRPVEEATVSFRAGRWQAPPGSVVLVDDLGPANGRWLVWELRRSLYSLQAEAQLVRATKALPEPAASTTTGAGRAGLGALGTGDLRSKVVQVAKECEGQRDRKYVYSMVGPIHQTLDEPSTGATRLDCSRWVELVYKKAGAPDPSGKDYAGGYTGTLWSNGTSVSTPQPGDLVFYGTPMSAGAEAHVEIVLGDGKSIGFGSLQEHSYNYRTPAGFRSYL